MITFGDALLLCVDVAELDEVAGMGGGVGGCLMGDDEEAVAAAVTLFALMFSTFLLLLMLIWLPFGSFFAQLLFSLASDEESDAFSLVPLSVVSGLKTYTELLIQSLVSRSVSTLNSSRISCWMSFRVVVLLNDFSTVASLPP